MRALWFLIVTTAIQAFSQTPEELLKLAQESFTNPSDFEFDGTGVLSRTDHPGR
jgi:hypothetical protein